MTQRSSPAFKSGEGLLPASEARFSKLAAIAMIEARVELRDRCTFDRRFYIISAPSRRRAARQRYGATGGSRVRRRRKKGRFAMN